MARRRPSPLHALAVAAALILASCKGAGGKRPDTWGKIERITGSAEIRAEYDGTSSSSGTDFRQVLLREAVSLYLHGFAYDKGFLRFLLGGTLGLAEEDILDDADGMKISPVPGYDITLEFLPSHPYPITLWTRHSEDRTLVPASAFSSFVETVNDDTGASAQLRAGTINGMLSFRRTDIATQSLDSERRELRDAYDASVRHDSGRGVRSELTLGYDDVQDKEIDQDYTVQDAAFRNTVDLRGKDDSRKASFETTLNFQDWSGSTDFENLEFSEEFLWWINPQLDSTSRYEFQRYIDLEEQRRHAFTQTFIHRLYESLVTTAGAEVSSDSASSLDILRWGPFLEFDYRKETSLGTLTLFYGLSLEREDRTGEDAVLQVVDESHVLSSSTITLLANLDILPGTVVVTDASGGTLYFEGIDYALIPQGRRLEISRLTGGSIPDGSGILVDYEYIVEGNVAFDRTENNFRVSLLLFDHLDLHAAYGTIRNHIFQGSLATPLEDVTSVLLGADLNLDHWRFTAEALDYDSTAAPYRQQRAELAYQTRLGEKTDLSASLSSMRTFFEDGEDLRITTLQARALYRPSRTLSFLFEPSFRRERGRDTDQDVLTLRFTANQEIGKLRLRLDAWFESEDTSDNLLTQTFVSFRAERRW